MKLLFGVPVDIPSDSILHKQKISCGEIYLDFFFIVLMQCLYDQWNADNSKSKMTTTDSIRSIHIHRYILQVCFYFQGIISRFKALSIVFFENFLLQNLIWASVNLMLYWLYFLTQTHFLFYGSKHIQFIQFESLQDPEVICIHFRYYHKYC